MTDADRRALQSAVLASKEYERRLLAELERAEMEITKLRNSVISVERERDELRAHHAKVDLAHHKRLSKETRDSDAMSAMLDRIADAVSDYFDASAEECVADGVDGALDDLAAAQARVAELEGALDRLQDHHCSGLCDLVPAEAHDPVMDLVNAALSAGPKDGGT